MTPVLALQKLFEVRDQIHFSHLNTTSYAEHKALNEFYDSWLDLADEFVEVYQGKYSRITGKITTNASNTASVSEYLKDVYTFVDSDLKSLTKPEDEDLLNLIADMKALINKTQYLLTLV